MKQRKLKTICSKRETSRTVQFHKDIGDMQTKDLFAFETQWAATFLFLLSDIHCLCLFFRILWLLYFLIVESNSMVSASFYWTARNGSVYACCQPVLQFGLIRLIWNYAKYFSRANRSWTRLWIYWLSSVSYRSVEQDSWKTSLCGCKAELLKRIWWTFSK